MSNLGSSQQIHTDEELKSMAKLFQLSAGIFSKLKETILALVNHLHLISSSGRRVEVGRGVLIL